MGDFAAAAAALLRRCLRVVSGNYQLHLLLACLPALPLANRSLAEPKHPMTIYLVFPSLLLLPHRNVLVARSVLDVFGI